MTMFEKEITTEATEFEIFPKYACLGFIKVKYDTSEDSFNLATLKNSTYINIEKGVVIYGSVTSLPGKKEKGIYIKIKGEKDINIINEDDFLIVIKNKA